MTEIQRDYQAVDDASGQEKTVSGRKFFPIVAGKTNGADQKLINDLKSHGQVEVDSKDADYLMVFCPIASRVETDISEALSNVPGNKDIIVVVMHHTFDPDRIVAESSRHVHNPNVILTVDYLFHDGKLLSASRNDISWHEITKVLGIPNSQTSRIQRWARKHRRSILLFVGLCGITWLCGRMIYNFVFYTSDMFKQKKVSAEL